MQQLSSTTLSEFHRSGGSGGGDLARQNIKSFLLDVRQHGKRYDFSHTEEVQRFCSDCILYLEGIGVAGVDPGHVLQIIEMAPELSDDPIIRDARAVLGWQRSGTEHRRATPAAAPDVATQAFADTHGSGEAGDFEQVDLAWQMAALELGMRGNGDDDDDESAELAY